MTSLHALYWNIFRWNFDVEHEGVLLAHNVKRFDVAAATFDAMVLKGKPAGEGGMLRRLEEVNVKKVD